MYRVLPSHRPHVHLIFWALAFLHLFIPLYNHFVYRTFGYDFAVYNFAFYDFAHFRNSPVLLYHTSVPITFFQDHFSLLLPLLSPLYWVVAPVAGTYSLLVVQWCFITAGALFTFRLIALLTKSDVLPLLSIVLYFLLHGRFSAYRTDVNLVIMGSAMVPAFIYFFYRQKIAATWITFVLLLITREDFSLWLVFISLFLALDWRRSPQTRNRALLMAGVSVGYFILCFALFIPVFIETNGRQYSLFEYRVLGPDPMAAIRYFFHDPVRVFQLLFINHDPSGYYDHIKTDFYVCYLLSGLALLFFRPRYLIPLIPLIAKKMLNDQPSRWGTESYYAVEAATLLPLLVFMVIATFRDQRRAGVAGLVVCLAAFTCTMVRFNIQPVPLLIDGPPKTNPFSLKFYGCEYNRKAVRDAIVSIPGDVSVSASLRLAPHLAFRQGIYLFPRKDDDAWVILLKKGDSFPFSQEEADLHARGLTENGAGWKIEKEDGDVVVLRPDSKP